MPPLTTPRRFAWSLGAGVVLGVLYTASPLTCWAVAAFPVFLHFAGRGLPAAERRLLFAALVLAFACRAAVIGGLVVAGLPWHNDLAVGALSGDEAYNLSRALRTRDVLLGLASSKYDYIVAFDEYGRSSYVGLLTVLQIVFGPTPYSIRVLNSLLFLAGATILYRLVRKSYGTIPAFGGLTLILFLPSLFHVSVTALKESLYFFTTAILLSAVVATLRARQVRGAALAVLTVAASLWLLDDLRRGALALAGAGIAAGLALRLAGASRRYAAAALLAIVVGTGLVATTPALQQRLVRGVETAAKLHSGHVYTVGHAYKLLDQGFYVHPQAPMASTIALTPAQATRFVVRAAASFALTPLPWELASLREVAFLPEHLLWYLLVAVLPVGLVAGWRRDPLVTCVLLGYAAATAAVLAATTGNVGTLVRLRGLVSPYVIWISVLGSCATLEWLLRTRSGPAHYPADLTSGRT